MTEPEKQPGHSRWWVGWLAWIGVLGGGLLGAVVGAKIVGATCDDEEGEPFDLHCLDLEYAGILVGLLVGLLAGALLVRWLERRSSRPR